MKVARKIKSGAARRFKAHKAMMEALAASFGLMRSAAAIGAFKVTKSWLFLDGDEVDAPQTVG